MKDWIEQNINPPGMHKKNRGSLFSLIGEVYDRVRSDANKAFNAHFPYLADVSKLREHGKSLGIPEFPHDSEKEYRDRVSTASFFLARAGERSYIMEQMRSHFGDDFVLTENFLQVLVNIAEMNEEDRVWVHSLLDELLDPNINLTISEWFHLLDEMPMSEELLIRTMRHDVDSFAGSFFCNGQFYCDQGKEIICDGSWLCDGSVKAIQFIPAKGTVSDYILEGVYVDGSHICDGDFDCSGYDKVFSPLETNDPILPRSDFNDSFDVRLVLEPLEDTMQINALCDGSFLCDGSNASSVADGTLQLRIIKQLHCDGVHTPSCSVCDGSIICDGSYSGYDGLYYSGDKIFKEVLR